MTGEEIVMYVIGIIAVIVFLPFFLLLFIPMAFAIYAYDKWERKQYYD